MSKVLPNLSQTTISEPETVSLHLLILAPDHFDLYPLLPFLPPNTIRQRATLENYATFLEQYYYDAVLAIYAFSDLNPLDFTEIALKILNSSGQKIPLLLMTKALGDQVAINCLKMGVYEYILWENLDKLPQIIEQSISKFKEHLNLEKQGVINQIITTIWSGSNLEITLQKTINLIHETLGVDRCLLLLPDHHQKMEVRYLSETTLDKEIFLNKSCEAAEHYRSLLSQGKPLILPYIDHHSHPTFQRVAAITNLQACLIMPLVYQQSYLGLISLHYCQETHDWVEAEINLMKTVTQQLAIALYLDKVSQPLPPENPSHFFSIISHELRSPLAGILGFARMLLEQIYGPLNDKQVQYISAIASSGEYLLALINDLLDFSKIEANHEELYLETIAIEDICLASLSLVEGQIITRNLALKLELDPTLTTCRADNHRLKQILVNLLTNAIKFTESGSVTLQVQANLLQNCFNFTVIDTGIGIEADDFSKLFQPFQQISNHLQQRHQGTGLGLALSRKLAQLHGGDITVTSTPGKGSCFTLHLPIL